MRALNWIPQIVLAVLASTTLVASAPAVEARFGGGFRYGEEPVRGVSLGGWLVIEDFTTHSLFDATNDTRILDEWTFGQYQDKKVARAALEKHWSTYITEDDFRQIKEAGLNHVRIPIGYWAFNLYPGDQFVQGQLPYLLKAVEWAEKYGLRIIIDLYGAPGSQNGFINSGHLLPAPGWQTSQTNIDRTTKLIERLVGMFKDKTHVVPIIAVLNEPFGIPIDNTLAVARKFYEDSYNIFRVPQGNANSSTGHPHAPPKTKPNTDLVMMTHDAFQGVNYWAGFLQPPKYEGVMLDSHIYQMFTDADNAETFDQHVARACANFSILATSPLPTIIGEWTATATDCGKGLNGRFTGARYDGSIPGSHRVGSCVGLTGDASTFSEEYKDFMRRYFGAQVRAYERGGLGWVMWSWKMEDVDEWSYSKGLEWGWIPRDLDEAGKGICESLGYW